MTDPIFEELSAGQSETTPVATPEPAPVDTPESEVVAQAEPADDVNHDDEDVAAALERETDDGSGFNDESELPPEDFDVFAENDVEVEES